MHENLCRESSGDKMAQLLGMPKAWEIVHFVFKNGPKAISDDCVSPKYWSNGLWKRILLREQGIYNDNIIFSKPLVEWMKACPKMLGDNLRMQGKGVPAASCSRRSGRRETSLEVSPQHGSCSRRTSAHLE